MYTRRLCLGFSSVAGHAYRAGTGHDLCQVTGAVKQLLTLSADDLAKMPRASVKRRATVCRRSMKACGCTKC